MQKCYSRTTRTNQNNKTWKERWNCWLSSWNIRLFFAFTKHFLVLTLVNLALHFPRILALNRNTQANAGSQHLLSSALQSLRQKLRPLNLRNTHDLLHSKVTHFHGVRRPRTLLHLQLGHDER